jgi:hypothetical protein
MATSSDSNFKLDIPATGSEDWRFGLGVENSDLDTVYHYTDFAQTVRILKLDYSGGMGAPAWLPLTSTAVTVSSFTVTYNTTTYRGWTSSQAIWVTGSTATADASITFGGQHQGVFEQNQWFVRNSEFEFKRNYSNTDTDDSEFRGNYEVSAEYITVRKSRDEIRQALPGGFYEAFKFIPDRTLLTSITITVNLRLGTGTGSTGLTVSATQTVRNDWQKMLTEVRNFVYEGKGELRSTKYNQGGTLQDVLVSSMTVTNTTTPGSGATITVYTTKSHAIQVGNVLNVTVTSVGTGHSLAQGQFNVISVPTTTSFTYTVTSTGTITVTSSTPLRASIKYLGLETTTIVVPRF